MFKVGDVVYIESYNNPYKIESIQEDTARLVGINYPEKFERYLGNIYSKEDWLAIHYLEKVEIHVYHARTSFPDVIKFYFKHHYPIETLLTQTKMDIIELYLEQDILVYEGIEFSPHNAGKFEKRTLRVMEDFDWTELAYMETVPGDYYEGSTYKGDLSIYYPEVKRGFISWLLGLFT